MQKILFYAMLLQVFLMPLVPDSLLRDVPANGEVYFKIKEIWSIEDAGEEPFSMIRDMKLLKDGKIVIYDNRNLRFYVVDNDGNPVSAFGRSGEGPGEIRQLRQAFLRVFDNSIIVADPGRLHYFSAGGKFRFSRILPDSEIPILFLSEDIYITAPTNINQVRSENGIASIREIDLQSGKQKQIGQFNMHRGGVLVSRSSGSSSVSAAGLTPMTVLQFHNGTLYYGISGDYRIYIADGNGKVRKSFGLIREKRRISDQVIEDELVAQAKDRAPVELLKNLAKTLPNEMTYFERFEVHAGLLYVYTSYYVRENLQQIDIFDLQGKYLYRAFLKVNEELKMVMIPRIQNGYAYICLENPDGDIRVSKYRIEIP